MIIITKAFEYEKAQSAGKDLGSMIFLDNAATLTIESKKIFNKITLKIYPRLSKTLFLVCCKFKATASASSDGVAILAGQEVSGKLDAVGSWEGSLKVEFTDNAYATKKTDAVILGESHYVKVSWTVATDSPLAQKINW